MSELDRYLPVPSSRTAEYCLALALGWQRGNPAGYPATHETINEARHLLRILHEAGFAVQPRSKLTTSGRNTAPLTYSVKVRRREAKRDRDERSTESGLLRTDRAERRRGGPGRWHGDEVGVGIARSPRRFFPPTLADGLTE